MTTPDRQYRLQADTCQHLGRILDAAQQNQTARGAVVTTHDPDSAVMVAREVGRVHGVSVQVLSMASRQTLRPGAPLFETVAGPAADPVDVLRAGGDAQGAALVVFRDMLRFVSDAAGDPRARALVMQMLSADNHRAHVYAFCEPPDSEAHIPAFARTLLTRVAVALPRGAELVALTREELAIAAARSGKALEGGALAQWAHRFAAELPGLSQAAARFAIQDALSQNFDLEGAVQTLADRKAAHLQAQLAMQVLRSGGDPPVGMDNYYRWIRLYRDLMCVPGPERVKGAVLLGPPGTGKTRLGAYTAQLLGVPAVNFRFGALLGKYVGQSEATAERAFAVLDALGTGVDSAHERGVVVVLDEIEKTVTRGDNDGGVSMRVTARMLNWMSESTAPNMILATANDLESMGELADIITRRGRLDRVFFVDVPNQAGRGQLFERLLARVGCEGPRDSQDLAQRAERFSGADIEAVVRDARAEARAEGQLLAMGHVVRQIDRNRIRVLGQYERFSRLREWARLNAEMAGESDGARTA
jgi:hypothetical protein